MEKAHLHATEEAMFRGWQDVGEEVAGL